MKKFRKMFTGTILNNSITLIIAISFFVAITNLDTILIYISGFLSILSPILYAAAVAFVLNPAVKFFQRKLFKNSKRKIFFSIAIVYIITLLIIFGLIVAVAPQVTDTVTSIAQELPGYLMSLNETMTKLSETLNLSPEFFESLNESLASAASAVTAYLVNLVPEIFSMSISIGSMVINLLTTFIASIYMLATKDKLLFQIKKALFAYAERKYANKILEVARTSNEIFSGFIIGKMIDSAIIGVICFVGMLFIHPPFAVLISIIVGVTNMIQFFGPFIGAIPSAFILLMVSPETMLIFIVFILVLQQVDGNIIGPKILGDSTGLSAIWVLVAIIIGGGLFGILGMFIGIPTFAVIYRLVAENISKRLKENKVLVDVNTFEFEFKPFEHDDE